MSSTKCNYPECECSGRVVDDGECLIYGGPLKDSLDYARECLKRREQEIRDSQDKQRRKEAEPAYCSVCHKVFAPGTLCHNHEHYIDGTGHYILVHTKFDCKGPNCVIHNPSDHKMKDWKTHWRWDRLMMERICPHGVGHPDPDDLAFKKLIGAPDADGVHGCDGCCIPGVDERDGCHSKVV